MVATRGDAGHAQLLLCRVGSKICGIPLEHVIETMRPASLEALADMSELTLGVAMIRGRPTPIIDGRRLLGCDASQPPKRFVTLELERQRTVALAVDDVLDVRAIDAAALEPLPAILRGEGASSLASLGALDRELLVVLERAQLLPESFWKQLEQAPTP